MRSTSIFGAAYSTLCPISSSCLPVFSKTANTSLSTLAPGNKGVCIRAIFNGLDGVFVACKNLPLSEESVTKAEPTSLPAVASNMAALSRTLRVIT